MTLSLMCLAIERLRTFARYRRGQPMISVRSEARFKSVFKSSSAKKAAALIGLSAFLCSAAPGEAVSQPAAPATCRTPAVEAKIEALRKEIADREPRDETARKVITSMMNGYPISINSTTYRTFYDYLQRSIRLRQELAQLEGLPPCPQPPAPSPVNSTGQYNSPPNVAPSYTGYPAYYNSPFYNAPWEGGGFYFGPTGSLSALRDSDLIKHIEPRSSDTFLSMPRSITGGSTSWRIDSGSSSWVASSNPWRLNTEGGSKTRVLSSSTGYDVGARAGYRFGDFRFEGEFDYANNSASTLVTPLRLDMPDFIRREDTLRGSTTGMTFLGNVIYDWNVPGLAGFGVTPHVLGGIGVGQISTDLKWGDRTIVNSSDWNFAYQLGAGVRYQFTPAVSIDLDYRYRAIADVTLHNQFERITVPYRSHNFLASLTYGFSTWTPTLPLPAVTPYTPPPPMQYTPPPPRF